MNKEIEALDIKSLVSINESKKYEISTDKHALIWMSKGSDWLKWF